jgi:hypothetical protein
MANSLLTISMITREAVRLWKNTNAFLQNVDMQYDDYYAKDGAKIGATLRIRLPNDYVVTTGPGLSLQDPAEQQVQLVMATQKHVDVGFSTAERTLSLQDYSRRIMAPAVNNLAGSVAMDIMSGAEGGICNIVALQDSANTLYSPNQTTYLLAGAALDLNSGPVANRRIVNGPITEARVVGTLSGLLNPASAISSQYESGRMYDALGFMWMKDQTAITHTNGALAQGSATVNGANQTGLTLTVNALAAGLNVGDIITIAGVNAVNRITKQDTGQLRQFVVTATAAASATSISIYPAIIPPSGGQAVQYQTVTASPANSAAVNPALGFGANQKYRKNFAYCPEAITLATGDLEMPTGGVIDTARESFDGVSMRMITGYLPNSDQIYTRLDVLYGYLWIRPEWACVVCDTV